MKKKSAIRQLHKRSKHRLKPAYAAVLLAFTVQTVQANPTGGTVVHGSASFAASGNTLTVTNTPGTIINWQGFSIGSNEVTDFVQQSASSAVLNRVIGNDPSNILGTLHSNGRVFLINPHGIVFGAGSVVDVAGLVASTLNLSDANFLAGKYHFTKVGGAGDISNGGNISAQDKGQIYLIAHNVENTGVINAPNGEILLAAGASVDLVNTNDPNLRVNITAPAGKVTNVGQLIASSGSLGLFGTVVSNSGLVSADSATMQGGKIVFKATQRVDAGGTISAQGEGGGTINLQASKQNGTVNVTGTLDASAPVSGDGGFIDTSAAKVEVADSAHITTSAPNGKSGTWLIDPTDFTIASGSGLLTTSGIGSATLSTSLGSGNVTIQTSASGTGNGDIFVNAPVSWGSNTLTLSAARNININANLNGNLVGAGPPGSLMLEYGQGAVALGNKANYYLNNGAQVNLLAGNNFSTKLGSDGTITLYTVITSLGLQGSTTGTDLQGINGNLAGNYVLGADIDATATGVWNAGAGFTPLGDYQYPGYQAFTGRFDGLGHTVSNLYINLPSQNYVGMFGHLSGSVSNLVLNANVTGWYYVGGLTGWNDGTISYSTVNGTVTGGGFDIGGMVGVNYGTISNSSASGTVMGSVGSSEIGGMVGINYGTISNSYAASTLTSNNTSTAGASVVGGLVGNNNGTISNSYVSTGSVKGSLRVGGLVGTNNSVINNSHYDIGNVQINGANYVTLGGLYNDNPTNGSAGQYSDWLNHGLTLNIANYASLSGNTINGVQGLKDLLGFADNATYTFNLGSNIDLASNSGLYIPYLAADFNGNNHSISNLSISQPFNDNLGLFGNVAATSTVSNVTLMNASVTGNSNVGPLVGWNQGTISGSHIDNSNTIGGNMSGNSNVGGLVGSNDGTIKNSYVDNSNSVDGGYVSGNSNVGGLVGHNNGTISSSYYDNTNAYGGSVSGNSGIGGLVGYNSAVTTYNNSVAKSTGGVISNSYVNNGKVSGSTEVGGLVGYSRKGSISNSHVYGGSVTGFIGNFGASNIGGLVGYNNTDINASYVSGGTQVQGVSSVGGLVGYNDGGEGAGNITGSYFDGGTVTGSNQVGGLVGSNYGATSQGKAGGVISTSYVNNGAVTGSNQVGGLAGYNTGKITGSYVSGGTVVTGASDVGGLVGQNGGTTTYNYYNFGTISNSYVDTGTIVNGGSNVGGLVGINGGGATPDGGNPQSSTISNSYVNGGSITATSNVGGLVGYNMGTINKASHVIGSSINGVSNVGGLAGYNAGIATSNGNLVSGFITGGSYVSGGTVTGTGSNVGGLAGYNSGAIDKSSVKGVTVSGISNVAGLVGYNGGTIDKSSVSGAIVSGNTNVGGLVGFNGSSTTVSNFAGGIISNSYVSGGTVTGSTNVGGLVGYNSSSGTISGSHAIGAIVSATSSNVGGLVGYNSGLISSSYVNGGSVTGNLVIDVGGLVGYNAGGLIDKSYVKSVNVSGGSNVGGLVGFNASGSFSSGSFFGSTITGSYVSGGTVSATSSNVGGLVGDNLGNVNSDYVDGVTVTSAVSDGSANAGGLVGNNIGNISISYASNISVIGTGNTVANFGGLVGNNSGDISNTYVSGGTVTGDNYVGGLVGSNFGNVNTSYASINVVSGGGIVGGLIGYNSASSVGTSANFWNITTASAVSSGIGSDVNNAYGGSNIGAIGMTDANMRTLANFNSATVANGNIVPGWDISASGATTVWHITEGVSMPLFAFSPVTLSAAPNVIDEIVDITDQREKRALDDIAVAGTSTDGGNGQTLPMCN